MTVVVTPTSQPHNAEAVHFHRSDALLFMDHEMEPGNDSPSPDNKAHDESLIPSTDPEVLADVEWSSARFLYLLPEFDIWFDRAEANFDPMRYDYDPLSPGFGRILSD